MSTAIQDRLRDEENFGGMELRLAAAERIERLEMQVVYLRWAAEQAADDIERGREFDALHGLRTALASGSPTPGPAPQ